jgi:hypothetical protein
MVLPQNCYLRVVTHLSPRQHDTDALRTILTVPRGMSDTPGLSDQYRMASPWPLFVAVGLPVAELGVLFGLFPVAVGGLLLFCGSVAGMIAESGYAATPWPAVGVLGVLCLAVGAWFLYGGPALPVRGQAVGAAGLLLLFGAVVGKVVSFSNRDAAV